MLHSVVSAREYCSSWVRSIVNWFGSSYKTARSAAVSLKRKIPFCGDDEPPYKLRRDECMSSYEERNRSKAPRRPWPAWTTNFPLMSLSDTVLREVLGYVNRDDRIQLSHTNRKLRNILIHNQSPDMDRRKTLFSCRVSFYDSSITVDANTVLKEFADIPSFKNYMEKLFKNYYYTVVQLSESSRVEPVTIDFSDMVEFFEQNARCICWNSKWTSRVEELLHLFMNYDKVLSIVLVGGRRECDEFYSTLKQWADQRDIRMERKNSGNRSNHIIKRRGPMRVEAIELLECSRV